MVNPPPFDPLECGRVGRDLAAQPPADEARYRSAIGRLYYSLFLTARDNLRVEVQQDVHSEVIRQLRQQDRRRGDQLKELRRIRTAADYEMAAASRPDGTGSAIGVTPPLSSAATTISSRRASQAIAPLPSTAARGEPAAVQHPTVCHTPRPTLPAGSSQAPETGWAETRPNRKSRWGAPENR